MEVHEDFVIECDMEEEINRLKNVCRENGCVRSSNRNYNFEIAYSESKYLEDILEEEVNEINKTLEKKYHLRVRGCGSGVRDDVWLEVKLLDKNVSRYRLVKIKLD